MEIDPGWLLAQTAAGAWADADAVDAAADWMPAIVPGTVGSALRALGRWAPDDAVGFDAFDHWYRSRITGDGAAVLRFGGLATIAEVYCDGVLVHRSENMFLAHEIELTLRGSHELLVAFRSLDAFVAAKRGRARWRPKLVRPPALRFARTLLLGHIPGWGPPVHAVGPYRPVTIVDAAPLRVLERRVVATVDEGDGMLDVAIRLSAPTDGWVTGRCGLVDFALADNGDGFLRGEVEIPAVDLWWPHTHGRPALYPLEIYVGEQTVPLGSVGFRTIAVDRDADGRGFGLVINGERVFCRGACWTSADIVALPFSRAAYEPLLRLARDAGMNMLRVGGTMGYEADAFYELCDELGLMVWQDFAFSNFDYPAGDPAFCASVAAEATQFLARTQLRPSLTVLCGASEVAQQSAMLGMPPALWSNAIFDGVLPDAVRELRADVPYTAHSPWGGNLPFVADEGISHYYGVSAHLRPIEEARRAHVRFSAESLGFANVPDVAPFALEPDRPAIIHPDHVERVPHEVGASWAFEDIRNHYTALLYDVDVAALRSDDPERFLAFARATSAEVMEATFAEWRREGSATRGALVWFLRDLLPGAGWGVLDSCDAPKAAYWGLKRAFKPVTVVLTDENLNGAKVTLINETADPRPVSLLLRCLRDGCTPVMSASLDLVLAPRSTIGLAASTIWGGFFDATYAYRFGDPSHDIVVATLTAAGDGDDVLAESALFPLGRGHQRHDLGLAAELHPAGRDWRLVLSTTRFAQSVRIRCDGYSPDDSWCHVAPGSRRAVMLRATGSSAPAPKGTLEALNGRGPVEF